MGLCFSYQQQKDVERLSVLLTSGSLSQIFFGSYEIAQDAPYDRNITEEHQDPNEKVIALSSSCDISIPAVDNQVISEVQSLTPDTTCKVDDQTLERRRRRDERRAARMHGDDKMRIELLKSPIEYLEDRHKVDFHVLGTFNALKKCLVLDIDYTIFDHKSDFELAPEFRRPYLHEFLKACNAHYNIIIWSATAFYHIHTKMEKLQLLQHPDFQICLALCKDHMIPYSFSLKRKTFFQDIKPLSVLWNRFPQVFSPANTIHIDDVAENFAMNPQNGLRIDPFQDALYFRQADRELFYLTQYLTMIAPLNSFEDLDHGRWKDYIINTLWNAQTIFSLPPFSPPGPASQHLIYQHEQSLLLKRMMKEKAKEKEREERARREREEKSKEDKNRREQERIMREMEASQRRDITDNGKERDAFSEETRREENTMFLTRIDSKLFREQFNSLLTNQQNDTQNQPASDIPDPPLDLPDLPRDSSLSNVHRLQPINRQAQRHTAQRQGQRSEQGPSTRHAPLQPIKHKEKNLKQRRRDKDWTVGSGAVDELLVLESPHLKELSTPAVFCS